MLTDDNVMKKKSVGDESVKSKMQVAHQQVQGASRQREMPEQAKGKANEGWGTRTRQCQR